MKCGAKQKEEILLSFFSLSFLVRGRDRRGLGRRGLGVRVARVLLPARVLVRLRRARLPARRVALEAAAEPELPDAVALLDAAAVLDVGEDVPRRGRRRVAEARERLLGRRGEVGREAERRLELVDDAAPARVEQKVLKGLLEVGHVRLVARGLEELAPGEDFWAERGDVGLEGAAGDGDDVFAEEDAFDFFFFCWLGREENGRGGKKVNFCLFILFVLEETRKEKKNSKQKTQDNSPMTPSASSPLPMHPNASSCAPRCVRTVCVSWYLATLASAGWLLIRAHAPPRRKRQLTTSIERSWPTYL